LLAAFDLGPAAGFIQLHAGRCRYSHEDRVEVGNAAALTKFGRLPREPIRAAGAHLDLSPSIVRPDRSNGIAWLIDDQSLDGQRQGATRYHRATVGWCRTSPVPLLSTERGNPNGVDGLILPLKTRRTAPGSRQCLQGGAYDFLDRISQLVRDRALTLEVLPQAA
jgi:hypothetical protein